MHLRRHLFRNITNSFSVFIFTRNCIPIMYERICSVFFYGIQNFSKFRLPRVLKKVQPTKARLDLKCFCNNQRFFTCVFTNHCKRRNHFLCFVSCIYHCILLIKVCVCSSIRHSLKTGPGTMEPQNPVPRDPRTGIRESGIHNLETRTPRTELVTQISSSNWPHYRLY